MGEERRQMKLFQIISASFHFNVVEKYVHFESYKNTAQHSTVMKLVRNVEMLLYVVLELFDQTEIKNRQKDLYGFFYYYYYF